MSENFVALEKRTDGKFLNAAPPHQKRLVRNVGESFKVSKVSKSCPLETLPPCHFETCFPLLADAELGNDRLIALGIVFLEVVEQATPLADQHEKSAALAVVFLVRFEVLRQLANAFAEQCDLHLSTAGVGRMRAIAVNYGLLLLSG